MADIRVNHTSIIIPNYNLGDCEYIENLLSVWNPTCFKMETVGFHYDGERRELRIPRSIDIGLVERNFKNYNIVYDYKPDPYTKTTINLKILPRDDIQKNSIAFLLGEGDFKYTSKYSQQTLNLDTGDGKTYCVIAGLTFLSMKSIIVSHTENIKGQWLSSLLQFTNIDEKLICNISGSKVIDKLITSTNLPYKVYLINHATIRSYAKKHNWDTISELFKKLEVGVKVYDEAHLEFSNIMLCDLYTNTKKTFYLTANFGRSGGRENSVYKMCFKNIAKYGIETRGKKRKHIKYLGVLFNTKPSTVMQVATKTIHGFSTNKYTDYIIEQPNFFDALMMVLELSMKHEGKILILLSKIDACEVIYNFIKERIPDKTIGMYHSKIKDKDKEITLSKEIIISTQKSLGTGTDIKGLRTVIMTEQYSSAIIANQAVGRLREYGPEDFTFYIELTDVGFELAYNMYKKRLPVFKKKCAKVGEYRL